MKIDVIIATSDRPLIMLELVKSLIKNTLIEKIIVVDSSSQNVSKLLLKEYFFKVHYVFSHRKNQPYQRYLGYTVSTSEILLFLDDDMEIAEASFVERITETFSNKQVGAIAINFKDKHSNTSLSMVPKSILNSEIKVKQALNWFTGYPSLKEGVLGLCGVRGKQPVKGGTTQLIGGGAFAVLHKNIYINFNFQLFDLYDKKVGKGEDVILGYTLHKVAKIYYLPFLLFYHNDNSNSNYAANHELFAKRVIYSRLYLSLEKCRLDNSNFNFTYLHYHWFTLWRILGLVVNWFVRPSKARREILIGSLYGWGASFTFKFRFIKTI
jgi:glycosyltransferase involved in cell wall biosynthesis